MIIVCFASAFQSPFYEYIFKYVIKINTWIDFARWRTPFVVYIPLNLRIIFNLTLLRPFIMKIEQILFSFIINVWVIHGCAFLQISVDPLGVDWNHPGGFIQWTFLWELLEYFSLADFCSWRVWYARYGSFQSGGQIDWLPDLIWNEIFPHDYIHKLL